MAIENDPVERRGRGPRLVRLAQGDCCERCKAVLPPGAEVWSQPAGPGVRCPACPPDNVVEITRGSSGRQPAPPSTPAPVAGGGPRPLPGPRVRPPIGRNHPVLGSLGPSLAPTERRRRPGG